MAACYPFALTHGRRGREDMAASGLLRANHPLSERCISARVGHTAEVTGWNSRCDRGQMMELRFESRKACAWRSIFSFVICEVTP